MYNQALHSSPKLYINSVHDKDVFSLIRYHNIPVEYLAMPSLTE